MDDFRVSSTSPYAQQPQRRPPDGGKRRKPHTPGEETFEDDLIQLSSSEPEATAEDSGDAYVPSSREEDY